MDSAGPQVANTVLLKWMFRFVKPVWKLMLITCLWVAAVVAVDTKNISLAGRAVNGIEAAARHRPAGAAQGLRVWFQTPAVQELHRAVMLLACFVILMVIVRYLKETASMRMSMTMVYYIREAVYDKLQRVGFGFHDAIPSGQLINRALSDLQNVRTFVQTAVIVTLDIVLAVLLNIRLINSTSPKLALLALIPLPIWTYYILRFSKRIQPVAKSVMEAEDRNVSIIAESIAGVHVIKAFATEQQEIGKYGENCDKFKTRVLKRIRMFANFQPVIRLIASASHLSLFWVAGRLLIHGQIQPGDLMILGGSMGMILGRLQQVATINEQYQNAIVSARRLHEVLMAKPTVAEKPDARPLPPGVGEVRFERVTFGYNAEKPILRDIDVRVRGGSIVAIVGPTGSGKSTLVSLLSRFYDPQQGRIFIDGIDLRDVSLASLRTQVTPVFQETYLFSETVAGNIAYGRPRISAGEIEAAARLAQAHEFIEQLPKGYDTVLGERGASLSGGQRQRLAIARAIVTNPRVLILDDATASIDPETEDLIRRGMRFVMHGRTTFIIAHRISTVKRADLVVVMEHGQIAQMGTHAELMLQDGHYRDIAAAQLHGDEERPEDEPSHMRRVQKPGRMAAATAAAGKNGDTLTGVEVV